MLVGVCSCMCIGDWNNGCLSVCLVFAATVATYFIVTEQTILECSRNASMTALEKSRAAASWRHFVNMYRVVIHNNVWAEHDVLAFNLVCLFSLRVANRALQFRTAFTWKPSNFGIQVEFLGVFSILSSIKFLNIKRWTREDYRVLCCWWRSVVIFMLWLFSSGI